MLEEHFEVKYTGKQEICYYFWFFNEKIKGLYDSISCVFKYSMRGTEGQRDRSRGTELVSWLQNHSDFLRENKLTWKYLHLNLPFPKCSVQSLSRVGLFATPWIAALQASLSITISRSSLKLTSIESVMPSSHLILCHPLFLLPTIPPSIRVFSNESTLCKMLGCNKL